MIKKLQLFIIYICIIYPCFSQAKDGVRLIDLNPKLFNQNFTDYDPNTAIFCAQLSDLAYSKENDIESFYTRVSQLYPEENIHYKFLDVKRSNTQALLWRNKRFLVIAFRGTEPSVFKDWLSDAKYWNYFNTDSSNEELANMPPGHGGFRKCLMTLITEKNLFSEIDSIIKQEDSLADLSTFPIYLTGHSLGAAISQLFIEPLHYRHYNFAGAYHFAPPLAVSCSMNDYMRSNYGNRVYDIVNYKDYVPRAGRNDVTHFGKFYRICKNGLLYKEKEAYVKFAFKEYLSEFALHSLKNHIKYLKKVENNTKDINARSKGNYPCMKLQYNSPLCGGSQNEE